MSTDFLFSVPRSGQLNILMSREQWLRTFYDFEESDEEEYDYPAAPIPPPRINTPLNATNLNVSCVSPSFCVLKCVMGIDRMICILEKRH